MMKQLNSALNFTINYQFNDVHSPAGKEKWSIFFKAFGWMLIIKLMYAILLLVCKLIGFTNVGDIVGNQVNFSTGLSESTILLYITLAAPIIEEISFRGWLTDKKYLVLFSCFSFCFLMTEIILDNLVQLTIDKWLRITVNCISGFAVSYLVYRSLDKFISFLRNMFRYAAIISIFLFAAIHALNYEIQRFSILNFLALLIIISPFFLMGFVLTYVRIKNGLIWSIGLHILNNSLILIFPLLRQ